jgi:hypothetical protein
MKWLISFLKVLIESSYKLVLPLRSFKEKINIYYKYFSGLSINKKGYLRLF